MASRLYMIGNAPHVLKTQMPDVLFQPSPHASKPQSVPWVLPPALSDFPHTE